MALSPADPFELLSDIILCSNNIPFILNHLPLFRDRLRVVEQSIVCNYPNETPNDDVYLGLLKQFEEMTELQTKLIAFLSDEGLVNPYATAAAVAEASSPSSPNSLANCNAAGNWLYLRTFGGGAVQAPSSSPKQTTKRKRGPPFMSESGQQQKSKRAKQTSVTFKRFVTAFGRTRRKQGAYFFDHDPSVPKGMYLYYYDSTKVCTSPIGRYPDAQEVISKLDDVFPAATYKEDAFLIHSIVWKCLSHSGKKQLSIMVEQKFHMEKIVVFREKVEVISLVG